MKTEIKHTPGPWTIETYQDGESAMIAKNHGIPSTPEEPIEAQIICHGRITEANARLIAAAPEMLDALKNLRRGNCYCECGIGNPMLKGEHTPVCKAARAAIAKAEGR